jgi:hypothetical protein
LLVGSKKNVGLQVVHSVAELHAEQLAGHYWQMVDLPSVLLTG